MQSTIFCRVLRRNDKHLKKQINAFPTRADEEKPKKKIFFFQSVFVIEHFVHQELVDNYRDGRMAHIACTLTIRCTQSVTSTAHIHNHVTTTVPVCDWDRLHTCLQPCQHEKMCKMSDGWRVFNTPRRVRRTTTHNATSFSEQCMHIMTA